MFVILVLIGKNMVVLGIAVIALITANKILWLIMVMPMTSKSINMQHIFNEHVMLLVVYMNLGFTDVSPDQTHIYSIG